MRTGLLFTGLSVAQDLALEESSNFGGLPLDYAPGTCLVNVLASWCILAPRAPMYLSTLLFENLRMARGNDFLSGTLRY